MTASFVVFGLLWILFGVRIEVASKLHRAILHAVHEVNMELIFNRESVGSKKLLAYADTPTTLSLIFDLTIWTRAQALSRYIIPRIVKELP